MAMTLSQLLETKARRRDPRDPEAERIRTRARKAFYTMQAELRECQLCAESKFRSGHRSREMNSLINDFNEALAIMDEQVEDCLEARK